MAFVVGRKWSVTDVIDSATHIVIKDQGRAESISASWVSLHAKLWGKAIVATSYLRNPEASSAIRSFAQTTQSVRKLSRQHKYKLFVSEAARDKHHKMHSELVAYSDSVRLGSHKASKGMTFLYSLEVRDGGASDLIAAIRECKSALDLKPIRWLVCKSERVDCLIALAGALARPPKDVDKFVCTMTQFVGSFGRIESSNCTDAQ